MTENRPIYLDYAATTPVDKRVLDEMLPYFMEEYGNAHSRTHEYGWKAEEALKKARQQVANLVHAEPEEIIFTSGATESINWALKGVFESYSSKGNHIITQKTEHKAVLDTCEYLETRGAKITYLDVDSNGLISLESLKEAITEETILVAIMYGNNETGVIQPVSDIGKICREKGVLFLCDATQAVGKVEVDVNKECIDLMAFSSHKMFGPKGVGALYIHRTFPRIKLTPLLHGGGHEKGYRSGTLNVPGIVGFGKAAELAKSEMIIEYKEVDKKRKDIERELLQIEGGLIYGAKSTKLPHIINFSIKGVDSEAILLNIRDFYALSTGSACTTSSWQESHVISLMSNNDKGNGSIRISINHNSICNTELMIKLKDCIRKLKML